MTRIEPKPCMQCDSPRTFPYSTYNQHPYYCYGSVRHIDIAIAPLILTLWADKIDTWVSCSGDAPGDYLAYIGLKSARLAVRLQGLRHADKWWPGAHLRSDGVIVWSEERLIP